MLSEPFVFALFLPAITASWTLEDYSPMMANLNADAGDRPPQLTLDLPPDVLCSRMEELRRWLARQNGLPPCAAPTLNRHAHIRQQFRKSPIDVADGSCIKSTYVGSPKNFSAKPLKELTKVSISKMLLRKDQYLLCRVVTPTIRMVGSLVVVEDPAGAVTDLATYNFPATGPGTSQATLDVVFPIGTIMAVREPLLKLAGAQGGSALSPDDLKEVENKYFRRGEWLLAVFAYSRGLRLDKDAFLLRLNRAEAYLRLSYWSAALFDAETVLWRGAKAIYFQGNYSAARDKFQESLKYGEDVDEAKEWLQRICKREEESEHGRFDWTRIFVESSKSPHIQHIADFRGPIKVKPLPDRGGGRGVTPIEVGQLLVVEKPFASVYSSDLPDKVTLSFNLLTNTVDKACHTVLISKVLVMERLWGNPGSHDALYNLYAGTDYPFPGLSQSGSFSSIGIQFPFQSAIDIDIMRLRQISLELKTQAWNLPPALYLFAFCLPSALWTCFGDVIVIRATKPIAESEEIYVLNWRIQLQPSTYSM
ncbi:hypothetical protein D9758_015171 [Tetrapyrgos nigripes]|uniref:Uncharacterized protein n=1 Tax=Tetrapyrgos nigripes TaxID=182062 RepID=A0A8H5C2L2_9AGAR|nr:hypothetical protein D9758_015171 [Tetrapyrgos nigripes]